MSLATKKCEIVINGHPITSVRHISIYLRLSCRATRFPRLEITPGPALHRARRWIERVTPGTVMFISRLARRREKDDRLIFLVLVACQTRLSLPPAADLDSLIQSFASTSDLDDPPQPVSNSSLNVSQIRRKLFSDEDDLLDETPPLVQPRRSSSFEVTESRSGQLIADRPSSMNTVHPVRANSSIVKIICSD